MAPRGLRAEGVWGGHLFCRLEAGGRPPVHLCTTLSCSCASSGATAGLPSICMTPEHPSKVFLGPAARTRNPSSTVSALCQQHCPTSMVYTFIPSQGSMMLLSSASLSTLAPCRGHAGDVWDLSWAPDSTALVSGSSENVCNLFSVEAMNAQFRLDNHKHFVQGVAWDPAREFILSQSSDKTVRWGSLLRWCSSRLAAPPASTQTPYISLRHPGRRPCGCATGSLTPCLQGVWAQGSVGRQQEEGSGAAPAQQLRRQHHQLLPPPRPGQAVVLHKWQPKA